MRSYVQILNTILSEKQHANCCSEQDAIIGAVVFASRIPSTIYCDQCAQYGTILLIHRGLIFDIASARQFLGTIPEIIMRTVTFNLFSRHTIITGPKPMEFQGTINNISSAGTTIGAAWGATLPNVSSVIPGVTQFNITPDSKQPCSVQKSCFEFMHLGYVTMWIERQIEQIRKTLSEHRINHAKMSTLAMSHLNIERLDHIKMLIEGPWIDKTPTMIIRPKPSPVQLIIQPPVIPEVPERRSSTGSIAGSDTEDDVDLIKPKRRASADCLDNRPIKRKAGISYDDSGHDRTDEEFVEFCRTLVDKEVVDALDLGPSEILECEGLRYSNFLDSIDRILPSL
jgi:hypothetical protein